jgi:hypothetical protein
MHAYQITTKDTPLTLIGRTEVIPANSSVIISETIYRTSNNATRIKAVGAEISTQPFKKQLRVDDLLVTPTTTSINSSATSVPILEENLARKGISLQNRSEHTLYLSFSSPATAANAFVDIVENQFLILDHQLSIANAIYGIWAGDDDKTVQVTEYI